MLSLVFGFVWPALLGHDRLRAKKMAATVAKILVRSPAVSASSNQFLQPGKISFSRFSRH
jgi:hypothetical protein